jgi:hypothetical protein
MEVDIAEKITISPQKHRKNTKDAKYSPGVTAQFPRRVSGALNLAWGFNQRDGRQTFPRRASEG